jgi:hypothetical protein
MAIDVERNSQEMPRGSLPIAPPKGAFVKGCTVIDTSSRLRVFSTHLVVAHCATPSMRPQVTTGLPEEKAEETDPR